MTEKKTTKAVATKKTATTKKSTVKKVALKSVVVLTAENVGFKAGDVYQALATAEKALTIAEIAKLANITEEDNKVALA